MSVRPFKLNEDHSASEAAPAPDQAARLILGMDGTIMFANDILMNIAGVEDVQGHSFLDLAAFDDPDEAFRHSPMLFTQEDGIFAALRGGSHTIHFLHTGAQVRLQFDIVNTQGGQKYIVASAMENDQNFAQTIDRYLDAAPVQAEATAHFLDLFSDLLIVASGEGKLESVNPSFTALLGFTLDDVRGHNLLDIVHPDDRASARSALQALMRDDTGRPMAMECRLITNDARTMWMEWNHKKADGKIYSVGRDVTHVKKHEQDLYRREQQLSEAEAIGHMGHWHWSIGQQEIRFSDEIYRIFGVSQDKFFPTLDSVGDMLHRRDAGRMMQAFQRAIIEQNDHDIDFRVVMPSGEMRYVRCRGRCEFDGAGDVIGLYGIMQDVTQHHMNAQDLMEAKDSAERAYAAKSQFLANMSHELRTPLNAIIGFSEMMQQQLLGPIGNDRYLDYIKGIRESGEHLLELITDILDMSKLEAGKYELDLDEMNLAKIARLSIHMMEGRAVERGIKIIPKIANESLQIMADRRAVTQILLNLLSNAVKFSPDNSSIEVECVEMNDFVSIRVKDNGIGIPANKLPTITNPFEQAANQYSRGHDGSGLGLSITKELTELHGGTLHIESQVNVGTTVTIRLPIRPRKAR